MDSETPDNIKTENFTGEERLEEILRFQKLRKEIDQALAKLHAVPSPGNCSKNLADKAAEGKYICITLQSDDEEMMELIDGEKNHRHK